MNRTFLIEQIVAKKTMLCVGLDSDLEKIPAHLKERPNGLVEFNKKIIDATLGHCVSYKLNTAFYEALGA
jgi:orotidine-5'-phosphate decarboxylase